MRLSNACTALPPSVAGSFSPPTRLNGKSLRTDSKLRSSAPKNTNRKTSLHIDTDASQPHNGSATYLSTSAGSRDSQSNSVRRVGICFAPSWEVHFGVIRGGMLEPRRENLLGGNAPATRPSKPAG